MQKSSQDLQTPPSANEHRKRVTAWLRVIKGLPVCDVGIMELFPFGGCLRKAIARQVLRALGRSLIFDNFY
ncbi:hypothetical protein IQ257_20185 [Coleofasciculus sp. LEGE 07092]|uniref:hypothetical protein n=1 Tax=Coleofasciculus sp. LEGE 07081 TaxID=2777967 RepID=UPI001881F8CE|nr:hypothetical protein [Coleofasciculus sp. LEGE 07081]MBE9126674.1 hypothetical protein [Coleofasciculus sp. LEGE 07081]MBE9150768.1 hypothetical protein [Coleofasciculus sp. LEGE 07092]